MQEEAWHHQADVDIPEDLDDFSKWAEDTGLEESDRNRRTAKVNNASIRAYKKWQRQNKHDDTEFIAFCALPEVCGLHYEEVSHIPDCSACHAADSCPVLTDIQLWSCT